MYSEENMNNESGSLGPRTEEKTKTALTFEIASKGDGGLVFHSEADVSPKLEKESAPSPKEAVKQEEEEFLVPDDYEDNPKYSTPNFVEDRLNIRATYVPRFTEASENYRKVKSAYKQEEKSVSVADPSPAIDPTADLDGEGETKGTVVVSVAREKGDEFADERISVFKFATEEEEREEDLSFMENQPVSSPAPETAPPTPEEEEVSEVEEEPSSAYVPPVKRGVSVFEKEVEPDSVRLANNAKEKKTEYTYPVQKDGVKDRFLDGLMSLKIRLTVAAIISLLVLSVTVAGFFGFDAASFVGLRDMTGAMAVLSIMVYSELLLLAIPEYIRAFKMLFKGIVVPEITVFLSYILLTVYSSVISAGSIREYPTFTLVFAVMTLAVIFGAHSRKRAEFISFKTVSQKGVKNIVEEKLTRDLPRENIAMDGAVDEYNSKTARVYRTSFVTDFFAHSGESVENSVNMIFTVAIGLLVSFFAGLLGYFVGGASFFAAAEVFIAVFMLSVPAASALLHKVTFLSLVKEAAEEEGTFVGEEAVYSLSEVDVVTYRDCDIFGEEDVTIRKVHLYGKPFNMAKAMKQMYALFSVTEGPLHSVFASSLDKKSESAEDVVIEENGVYGTLEGHTVYAGSEAFMRSHGIRIPDAEAAGTVDSTRVMYGAEDGEVYVKFYIRYSFSEEFTMLLPYLKQEKIYPLVYTRDPNINNDLFRTLTFGEDLIRVMKKNALPTDEDRVFRKASSRIVYSGDVKGSVGLVLLSKEYVERQRKFEVGELIYASVGALFAIVLSLTGVGALLSSALFALWQTVGCVLALVLGKRNFRLGKNNGN